MNVAFCGEWSFVVLNGIRDNLVIDWELFIDLEINTLLHRSHLTNLLAGMKALLAAGVSLVMSGLQQFILLRLFMY